jgi:hypothetical protein
MADRVRDEAATKDLGTPFASCRRVLIVHPLGGLGNRLRVVASAVVTAAAAGRDVVLDWPVDEACGAAWGDLFENRFPPLVGALPAGTRVFEKEPVNFPRPGPGDAARDPAPVVLVKTCFNFRPRAMAMERFLAAKATFYRSLLPVAPVARRLADLADAGLAGNRAVGVHIRRHDLILVGETPHTISPTARFVARMRRLVEDDPEVVFFVATDDGEEERSLRDEFPGRVLSHPKAEVRRDTVDCMRDALVDWLALARTRLILRSAGTSFSREAAVAGGVPRETIKRPLWPYDRPRYWAEAFRRRVAVVSRRLKDGVARR